MLFPTAEYAIFFVVAFAAAWGTHRSLRMHKGLLLLASYVFYGYWEWRFLPLLIGLSLLAAWVGRALQRSKDAGTRGVLLAVGVSTTLAVLGVFKYLGFAAVAALNFVELLGFHPSHARVPEVVLPVGISFFSFHAISLMVDAYRGRISVRVTVLDSLLYVAFFPQLVAGPILRASSFLPQLVTPRDPGRIDASRAVELLVLGLVKKVILANFLATRLVDPVFDAPGAHAGLEALFAVYGYAAQIYCDFSGYTDLALGSALLLGYRFPDNFDAPYLSTSPQEFWRRWHISLSSWLRDYLFIPLGGSKHGRGRTLANLLVTMLLGGLWHGAAFTFVLWGALHGAGLVVHRLWSSSKLPMVIAIRRSRFWPAVAWGLTFHFVCAGWILFRAPSLEVALELGRAIVGSPDVGPLVTAAAGLAILLGIFGQVVSSRHLAGARARFAGLPRVVQGLALAAAVLVIEACGPKGIAPFIYFQF